MEQFKNFNKNIVPIPIIIGNFHANIFQIDFINNSANDILGYEKNEYEFNLGLIMMEKNSFSYNEVEMQNYDRRSQSPSPGISTHCSFVKYLQRHLNTYEEEEIYSYVCKIENINNKN